MRGLTQGQNLCGGDDGVRVGVRGCAWVCVCERVGWMGVQPKTGKDEKCFLCRKDLKRSRKGEAAIKSRIV